MAYSILDSVFISDDRNIVSAGIVTAIQIDADNVGVNTDLTVGGNLEVSGIATIGGITFDGGGGGNPSLDDVVNINLSGILTAPTAALGIATVFDLTVYNQLKDSNAAVGAAGSILATVGGKLVWTTPEAVGIATAFAPGSTFFVAENGDDDNDGLSASTPWASISFALSQIPDATFDVLEIGAGNYEETFPLTVPNGVTIKGAGQRATLVSPSAATATEDGFKLGNACTVEDLSIGNMEKPAVDNSYAFSYRVGAAITTRSPYVSRVTVLNRGAITTADDPYGYNTPDNQPVSYVGAAGFNVDGSEVDASSLEAGFLLNEVTIFPAGNEGIRMTNGARAEVLNTFVYFASEGIVGESDLAVGFAGAGQARLSLDNATATPNPADVIEYYDTDGVTVLATGTVDNVSGNYVNLTDSGTGEFTVPRNNSFIDTNLVGGAQLSNAQVKFGSAALDVTSSQADAATASSASFGFGTGDYTVEGWFYLDALVAGRLVWDFRNTELADSRANLRIGADTSTLELYVGGTLVATTSASAITTSAYLHIAVARASGTVKIFVDGAEVASAADVNDLGTNGTLHLGANFQDSNGIEAYIDEFRIEKGVAKYTAPFTAPTAPFTGDNDTAILLHFDGTNGATETVNDIIVTQDIRFAGGQTAEKVTLADYSQFGADLRCVSSAVEYGDKGVVGDGQGVTLRLININFNHVGAGGDISNDPNKVIQTNEVTELNSSEVSYVSIDQKGDFRVGESFYVDQENGTVSFSETATDLTSLSSLTITDGVNSSLITPTSGKFGNIQISGNQIESTTGDVDIVTAGAGEVNIYGNTNIAGVLTASSISLNAIQNGDTSVALDDTGANGTIRFVTDGSEAGRFDNSNNLTVTNDISAQNVGVASTVTASFFEGDGSKLTNISAGNVDLTGTDQSLNTLVVTGPGIGITVDNSVSVGASVTAANFFGDLTGTVSATTVSAAGSVTANEFYGDGSNLTGVLSQDGGGNAELTGNLSVDSLEVSGLSTFTGFVEFQDSIGVANTVTTVDLVVSGDATINGQEIVGQGDNLSITNLEVTGLSTFQGAVEFESTIKFNDAGQVIGRVGIETTLIDSVAGIATNSTLPTQEAVKAYVDNVSTQVQANANLGLAGDTGTGIVGLATQSLNILGTANEIETVGAGITVTIGLPDDVTIGSDLVVTDTFSFDGGQAVSVVGIETSLVDTTAGVATNTSLPTQAAVKTYVDTRIAETGGTISFEGDTGSSTFDISDDTFSIDGTANQIVTAGAGTTLTIGLTDSVSVTADVTVGQNLTIVGVATANEFDSQSDARLKKNIRTVDNALNKLREINGVEFTWKASGERTIGVIAQQVEELFPELVRGDEILSVNYNGLIGVLIESVKELKLRVEELEEKGNS